MKKQLLVVFAILAISLLPAGAGAYSAPGWLYILPIKSNDPSGYYGTYGEISQQDPYCLSGQAYASSSNQIRYSLASSTDPFVEAGLTKNCANGQKYPYYAFGVSGDSTFYEYSLTGYPTAPAEYVAIEVSQLVGSEIWREYFNHRGTVISHAEAIGQSGPMAYAASGAEAGWTGGMNYSCYGCPTGYSNHRNLQFETPNTGGWIGWYCYDGVIRRNNNSLQSGQPNGCSGNSQFNINS